MFFFISEFILKLELICQGERVFISRVADPTLASTTISSEQRGPIHKVKQNEEKEKERRR